MFENKAQKELEKTRSRAIFWIGGIAALALIALVALLARSRPESQVEVTGLLRAGTTEFESYKDKVEIQMIETVVHPNMVGMAQHEVRGRVQNNGDHVLTAIEIYGKMIDLEDKVVAEGTSYPIPRARQDPLKPGESLKFSVKIDRPSNVTEEAVKDHAIELRGIRF